jgi:hypothetical protein
VNKIRRGNSVTVRNLPEIAATLDRSGTLEGLPFIPEMVKYCGQTFTVLWPVNKVLRGDNEGGLRQIKNTVLLDGAVCNGESHGDCQRMCFLLWKKAWIRPAIGEPIGLLDETDRLSDVGPKPQEIYLARDRVCQATELTVATTPLRLLDPRRYYWDLASRIYEPSAYLRYLLRGIYRKTLGRLFARKPAKEDPEYNMVSSDRLGLQRGDLVEVRSAEEIHETLDSKGRSQGLYFMPGMWGYCGRRFRVVRPVYRMMSERTGEMRPLRQTVILEGLTCNGKAHGGCQRGCFIFWKEAWLRRVAEGYKRHRG